MTGLKFCGLLFVMLFFTSWPAAGHDGLEKDKKQEPAEKNTKKQDRPDKNIEDPGEKPNAESQVDVLKDFLKAFEKKFDTLAARITSLEKTVSSLQFFSIRQFRELDGNLQKVNTGVDTVKKQVNKLEIDVRSQKITLSLLGRDVSELKKSSSDLLSELESSVVYINENVDKHSGLIKTLLEGTAIEAARETKDDLSRQMEEMIQKVETWQFEPVNCTVDLSGVSQHLDLRFLEFKKQTQANLAKLINITKTELKRHACVEDSLKSNNERKARTEEKLCDCRTPVQRLNKPQNEERAHNAGNNVNNTTENTVRNHKITTHQTRQDDIKDYQDDMDNMVMEALYNMTNSVLHAVSYFRRTGRVLEQILSNTDSLVVKQDGLTRRLGTARWANQVPSSGRETELGNLIPDVAKDAVQESYNNVFPGTQAGGCGCTFDVLDNIATVIKNGSQLLEVLTDLAQMSSTSLVKTTASLQDEITRVEGVRTHLAATGLARNKGDQPDPVSRLTNMTMKTFKLVEAVASNTGWLPQIFQNVLHLESLANGSLYLARQNEGILRQIHKTVTIHSSADSKAESEGDPTLSNRTPYILDQWDALTLSKTNASSKDDPVIINREALEAIYSTSLQLNRIMPALTTLLAKPDPLINLFGGGRPGQGRVEIYHRGLWGTLCHADLSHLEADLLCRHLGFKGGISAGAGYFGPGVGVTWRFNASCLGTSLCPVVTYLEESGRCGHEQDAAVICDHMLRVTSPDGSTNGKEGRLEIYHNNSWLPVCGEDWTNDSAKVACQQMGFSEGTVKDLGEWIRGVNSTWLGKTNCTGSETRFDLCPTAGWTESCSGTVPAGVSCV